MDGVAGVTLAVLGCGDNGGGGTPGTALATGETLDSSTDSGETAGGTMSSAPTSTDPTTGTTCGDGVVDLADDVWGLHALNGA